jgi:hypothetical protein
MIRVLANRNLALCGEISRSLQTGPFSDHLEKQRVDTMVGYQSALDEIRHARDESIRESQNIAGAPADVLIKSYDLLQNLQKQIRRLGTRIQSYEDRREDFEAWHQVSSMAIELDRSATMAEKVYGNANIRTETNELWARLVSQFETQSAAVPDMHRSVAKQIEVCQQHAAEWLGARREDFECQSRDYQLALAEADIQVDLRIPFDQEHPSESSTALMQAVSQSIVNYTVSLARRLSS